MVSVNFILAQGQTGNGQFPQSIIVSSSTDTTPHLLELKATQQDGTETLVSGFNLDTTNAVGAQANSQLFILVTDSSLRVMEAKVRTTSEQVIDLVPATSQQATNAFSLTNLAAGVYTLDVIAQKGNTQAAYEGILVIGQQPTNLQIQTIIKQQTTDDNGKGGNDSNGKLDVSIAVGRDPIVRGNIQTISIIVTDSQSGNGISGAKIDGQVTYVTGHVERFSGNSNGDGKYEHQWRISGNAKTGIFQVKVDASASGYGTASASSSFRVTGASQTGLLSQPDPCLDNSTSTDCPPNPCEINPDAVGCPPNPCDFPNPPPECLAPPTICPDGSTVLPGEDCPEPPAPPTICPDGSTVLPGEDCPEPPAPPVSGGDGGDGGALFNGGGDEGGGDEGGGDEGGGDEGGGDEGGGDEGSQFD
jgi:hypothetical protein